MGDTSVAKFLPRTSLAQDSFQERDSLLFLNPANGSCRTKELHKAFVLGPQRPSKAPDVQGAVLHFQSMMPPLIGLAIMGLWKLT